MSTYIPTSDLFRQIKAKKPFNNDQFIWVKGRHGVMAELNHEGILRFTPEFGQLAHNRQVAPGSLLDGINLTRYIDGSLWLEAIDLSSDNASILRLPLLSRPVEDWRFQCYAKADTGNYCGVAPVQEVNGDYIPITPMYQVQSYAKTKGNAIRKQVKDFTDWLETTIALSNGELSGSIISPYITTHRELHGFNTHQRGDDTIRTSYSVKFEAITHRFTTPLNPAHRDMSHLTVQGSFSDTGIRVANHGTPEQLDSVACMFHYRVGSPLTEKTMFNILTHPDLLESHDLRLKFVFILFESMSRGRWNISKSYKPVADRQNSKVSTDNYCMELNIASVKSYINRELITPHKGEEDVTIKTIKADHLMRHFVSHYC